MKEGEVNGAPTIVIDASGLGQEFDEREKKDYTTRYYVFSINQRKRPSTSYRDKHFGTSNQNKEYDESSWS